MADTVTIIINVLIHADWHDQQRAKYPHGITVLRKSKSFITQLPLA
ncbi:MAG: hypothetical protein ABGX05_05035 [Pirellulaceae bacterium]